MASIAPRHGRVSALSRRRTDRVSWILGYLVTLGITGFAGLVGMSRFPSAFAFALLVFLLGCVVVLVRPVVAVYGIAFFTFVGDYQALGWFPFIMNMSSDQSLLFVHPALNISPLEGWMALLVLGWVLQMAGSRDWSIKKGTLFWPIVAFTGFVFFGLVIGLSRGGDSVIALSEARGLTYPILLYPVITNVLTTRAQYVRMYSSILAGIIVNSVLSFQYIRTLPAVTLESPEGIMQHATPLLMNVVLVLLLAYRLFHGGSWLKRWTLLISLVPMVYVYLIVRRRAAIVGLLAGALLLFAVLFWTNRRRFKRFMPVIGLVAIVYTAAFWNTTSIVGFPAQAVKTVIAPNDVSDRDKASNLYRDIETFNVRYTIRSSPITGIGFGQPFLAPVALPAISEFLLARYMTHNSMLWVWMKTGVFGFIAMLYLFGRAMRTGAQSALRSARGEYAALTATSAAFVLMYATYTYVDIAWDVKSMVMLSLAFAQIDSVGLLPEEPAPAEAVVEASSPGELVGSRR